MYLHSHPCKALCHTGKNNTYSTESLFDFDTLCRAQGHIDPQRRLQGVDCTSLAPKLRVSDLAIVIDQTHNEFDYSVHIPACQPLSIPSIPNGDVHNAAWVCLPASHPCLQSPPLRLSTCWLYHATSRPSNHNHSQASQPLPTSYKSFIRMHVAGKNHIHFGLQEHVFHGHPHGLPFPLMCRVGVVPRGVQSSYQPGSLLPVHTCQVSLGQKPPGGGGGVGETFGVFMG